MSIVFHQVFTLCYSFDEFLMDMKQSKRKNIRQERKKVSLLCIFYMVWFTIHWQSSQIHIQTGIIDFVSEYFINLQYTWFCVINWCSKEKSHFCALRYQCLYDWRLQWSTDVAGQGVHLSHFFTSKNLKWKKRWILLQVVMWQDLFSC